MVTLSIAEELESNVFTGQLPAEVRRTLADIAEEQTHHEGATLFREGDAVSCLSLIISGHVALDMLVPAQGQQRILTLGPGEILAWSAVLGDGVATATCIATENCRLCAWPAEALLKLCDKNHDIGYAVMKALAQAVSRRLVVTRLQLLDLYPEH